MPKKPVGKKKASRKKRFNPADFVRKRQPGRVFRTKRREAEPNTFAGFATFRIKSKRQALRILNHYGDLLGFWQLKKQWRVKLPGASRSFKHDGYSKAQQPKDASGGIWTTVHLNRAIKDTSISAANAKGPVANYEGKQPQYVKPTSAFFDLLVWFPASKRRTLTTLVGRQEE